MTPLHFAVQYNHYDVAELLLINGAGVNLMDHHNYTPILLSVQNNNIRLTQLLINYKASVNKSKKSILLSIILTLHFILLLNLGLIK